MDPNDPYSVNGQHGQYPDQGGYPPQPQPGAGYPPQQPQGYVDPNYGAPPASQGYPVAPDPHAAPIGVPLGAPQPAYGAPPPSQQGYPPQPEYGAPPPQPGVAPPPFDPMQGQQATPLAPAPGYTEPAPAYAAREAPPPADTPAPQPPTPVTEGPPAYVEPAPQAAPPAEAAPAAPPAYTEPEDSNRNSAPPPAYSEKPPPPGYQEPAPPAYKESTATQGGAASTPLLNKDGEDAMDEHAQIDLPLTVRLSEISQVYGRTVYYFFVFERVLIVFNAIIMVIAMIQWLPFYFSTDFDKGDRKTYYIDALPADHHGPWIATTVIICLLSFALGPVYNIYAKRSEPEGFVRDKGDELIRYYDKEGNLLSDNQYRTTSQRNQRRAISYGIFILLQGVQAVLTFVFGRLQSKTKEEGTTTDEAKESFNRSFVAFLIALLASTFSFAFKKSSTILTNFERPRTWASFRKHNTTKLVLFKLVNLSVVYLARRYHLGTCISNEIALQFFWLLVTDMFLMNLVELTWPRIMAMIRRARASGEGSRASNENLRPQFDVSDEYLELITRQLLVLMAVPVFPSASILAFFGFSLEYMVDKYKLLRMCAKPGRSDNTMRSLIMVTMLVVAVASLIIPNAGVIWTVSNTYPTGAVTCCEFPVNRYAEATLKERIDAKCVPHRPAPLPKDKAVDPLEDEM